MKQIIKCPLCQSAEVRMMKNSFKDTYCCRGCDFIFTSLEEFSFQGIYEEDFARTDLHPTFMYFGDKYIIRNEYKLARILARLEKYRKIGTLLDVGCSAAFFLKLARDHGWEVRGVEVSSFGVNFSNQQFGIEVFQGTLQEANYQDEMFDVVCSSHVIEHLPDPRGFIREAKRVLRTGGALLTVLPTQYVSPKYLFLNKINGEGPPKHVSFFTKKTFLKLLRDEGFSLEYLEMNIELQRIFSHNPAQLPGHEDKSVERVNEKPPADTLSNLPIRAVKAIINKLGTLVGIGDELTTIAIKK